MYNGLAGHTVFSVSCIKIIVKHVLMNDYECFFMRKSNHLKSFI